GVALIVTGGIAPVPSRGVMTGGAMLDDARQVKPHPAGAQAAHSGGGENAPQNLPTRLFYTSEAAHGMQRVCISVCGCLKKKKK
ncbi:hypothetical protein SE11_22620, partial [Salmonella enterica subsp. enterica serovar Braenderup]